MNNHAAPVISASGLTKRFGDFTAVDDVHFDVHPGEIFGFLGPNGSGKTTTIRMLLGLIRPTAGEVAMFGAAQTASEQSVRRRVGYMSQRFSLYNDLTVLQNLHFYGRSYGVTGAELDRRVAEALDLAGLEGREKSLTRDLAGGWRQRLALSAAILHRPEVVFLDEPTAGVAPVSRRAFWDLLYRLVSEGITVFVTTHYMDEAEHCHRLAFIQRGRIIAYGAPADIKDEAMDGEVLEFAPSDPPGAVRALRAARDRGDLPLKDIELYGALVHVVSPAPKTQIRMITRALRAAGIESGKIEIVEPSLEDVFIAAVR
jgi:ABC-2 type transport system ATP-binding protein